MAKKGSVEVKGGLGGMLASSDRPWLQVTAQMHDHTMLLTGTPAKKFYYDAKVNIDASAWVSAYYDFDTMVSAADIYNYEVEALGGKMIYGENSMPTIDFRDPLIKKPEDLDQLRKKELDFKNAGRFPMVLEMMELNLEYGFSTGLFCSPFSLAVGMRTFPKLVRDMRRDPKFAHKLFTFLVDDILTPWIKTQNQSSDVLMAVGADAWACIPNLSIEEMNQWVVPYNLKLMKNTKKFGVMSMNVSGDYCEERLEKFDKKILHDSFNIEIASQGAPALFLGMGRWHEYPLDAVVEFTNRYKEQGVRMMVVGGINARLLRDGPIEKIVDMVKRYVDTFARDHDLTIILANIPADAPSEHIHAAVQATHTYGHLPIADDLDAIDFKLKKIKPFKEWKQEALSKS